MFSIQNIDGQGMKPKTLCLTYDDGPGPWTIEIAEFLHSHQIRATFFVLGKFAAERKEILEKLYACKHIVGNHTYDHPDIPYYCSVDGDLQDQIIRTNEIIRDYIHTDRIYFRAPYGKWSAEAAKQLNSNPLSSVQYTGPIHWEIPGIDCYYWKIGKSVEEAVAAYLAEIETKQSGIIVMHDEIGDMDSIRHLYKTLELTKTLIPILLEKGYRFVGLDEIESIQSSTLNKDQIIIQNKKGHFVNGHTDASITIEKDFNKEVHVWNMEFKQLGKVSIKNLQGKRMSVSSQTNRLIELSDMINEENSLFDFVPVREGAFMLRSFNGNFITGDKKSNYLFASAPFMRQAEIFTFNYVLSEKRKKLSLKKRVDLMKKRWLFIKGKLLQN